MDVFKAARGTEKGGKHLCIQELAGYIKMPVFIVLKVLVYKIIEFIYITL